MRNFIPERGLHNFFRSSHLAHTTKVDFERCRVRLHPKPSEMLPVPAIWQQKAVVCTNYGLRDRNSQWRNYGGGHVPPHMTPVPPYGICGSAEKYISTFGCHPKILVAPPHSRPHSYATDNSSQEQPCSPAPKCVNCVVSHLAYKYEGLVWAP